MEPREYGVMFGHEDTHWWFVGTRRVITRLVCRALVEQGRAEPGRLLDVGCGTGATLASLERHALVYGVELEQRGAAFCLERGLTRVARARAERLPFATASFDVVLALDVIEHITDDAAAMAELVRVARPGGHVLVTVPAHPFLWSRHDEALHHVRRYRRAELARVLRGAGLHIETLSWYNSALFAPIAAARLLGRLRPTRGAAQSDVAMPPALVNRALTALLGAEEHLVGRVRLPVGVSLIALCRVP